jgi:hypothetical protein
LALKDGLRSVRLWQEPAIAAWHRERVAQIIKDLGDETRVASFAQAAAEAPSHE